MQETLSTQRLHLRVPVLEDARSMAQLINGSTIPPMTASIPNVFTQLCAEFRIMRFRSQWRRQLGTAYAITTKNDGLIGIMDIFINAAGNRELGYWIGEPYWGKGYATEAARAVLDEAFRSSDLPYIDAGYYVDNPASGNVLRKLGFKERGVTNTLYSIARGQCFEGIELRLARNSAMNNA
ncbi:MAG TPA: N-acetyltransferase [Hellea balneolensis]|uniref:N-acetyltransferase n=1 Tax=Hellea balneolensis TaxID=287478 RepID=A0A7C3C4N7_9PROT|nr:N-acetyltransferase [Hellea balneolensis]